MNTVIYSDNDFDSYQIGVFKNNDGTFTALTACYSKTFKTYKGAERWLNRKLGK